MTDPKQMAVGEIISGTMITKDILTALYRSLSAELISELFNVNFENALEFGKVVNGALELSDEDSLEFLLDIENMIEEAGGLPPFCYLGAIEGDGACYGVWYGEEMVSNAIYDGTAVSADELGAAEAKAMEGMPEYAVVTNDHGNVTIYKVGVTLTEVLAIV